MNRFLNHMLITVFLLLSVMEADAGDEKIDSDGILFNKGLYAINAGDLSQAYQYFQEILQHHDAGNYYGPACYELASMAFQKGRYDEAHRLIQHTLASKPTKNSHSKALFLLGQIQENRGQSMDALVTYTELIDTYPYSDQISEIVARKNQLNTKILFSGEQTSHTMAYTVQAGDSLYKIAKKFDTTVELIKRMNHIETDVIHEGMSINIFKGNFSVLVDKSQKTLYLKKDDILFKTYRIAVGRDGITPVGKFHIINKLKDPVWYNNGRAVPPGNPDNILGKRWMGLDLAGYGIHGTTIDTEITEQQTSGCIRMSNQDVIELYSLLPVGISVTIVD